ncbi:MAG: hypothetical protein ACXABY_20155, partial [Candidatus Thorarchaeota archaeon]
KDDETPSYFRKNDVRSFQPVTKHMISHYCKNMQAQEKSHKEVPEGASFMRVLYGNEIREFWVRETMEEIEELFNLSSPAT